MYQTEDKTHIANNAGSSNNEDAAPPVSSTSIKANLSEKEEAAQIVARAMADKEQRDADAKKVKGGGMTKEELQELINMKTKKR